MKGGSCCVKFSPQLPVSKKFLRGRNANLIEEHTWKLISAVQRLRALYPLFQSERQRAILETSANLMFEFSGERIESPEQHRRSHPQRH